MTSGKLQLTPGVAQRLRPDERADIERAIPDGYRMSIGYQHSPGEWNVRIYDASGALVIIKRNQVSTIKAAAFHALAKLVAAGVSA